MKRIFSVDKTYVKFNEASNTIMAPQGIKRVGTACTIHSSHRCTVIATMDMLTPPFILDTGTFGGTLMKQWESFARGKVVFTKNRWMTSKSYIFYLQYKRFLCAGYHRIGLVVDKASVCTCQRKCLIGSKALMLPRSLRLSVILLRLA